MDYLPNVLRQINSPDCFGPAIKILKQINFPKLSNEIILLLRNIMRINNKDLKQFDGLVITVEVIKQTLNHDYKNEEWLKIGENYSCLVISVFDSILLYQTTPYIKNEFYCNLILEAGKALLPVVDKTECLRVSINNNGFSSLLQIICLAELEFLVRKEIFLLLKPIIVKSDTRQRKNIMNSNELFLTKLAAFILTCGDYETQEAIVEVLMRFSYTSKQKLNKILFWFRKYPNVLTATRLLDYKNFDISCRKFLNSINEIINSEDKVLTLPCLEAYANDIKLQKPNDATNVEPFMFQSEQYEELWVDFSLKTGIIHIVCDSGANAWLRLEIESKNVRKSFFSSRFFEKNETQVKGKQILLELISPLEIRLHLKESLIVSVSLAFVESPKLEYLQKLFFDKWYGQHMNKSAKNNQFEAMSKAYRENVVHQRCRHQDSFFFGASVSSLSSICSRSTCSFKNGCSKGNIRHSATSNCNRHSFLTSTPKNQRIQELSTFNQNLVKKACFGAENFKSSPSPLVNLRSTPSISGGIFNNSRIEKSQNTELKSSIVKGISISDDKQEDSLFKKMIEETLKKGEIKQIDNPCKNKSNIELNTNKMSSFHKEKNKQKDVWSNRLNSLQLKRKKNKPEMSSNNAYKISIDKINVLENSGKDNKVTEKDCSEESTFVLTTCSNKDIKAINNKNELTENNNSSLSQFGSTSDEAPIRPTSKQNKLLNRERRPEITITKLKPQIISEKASTSETTVIPADKDILMTASSEKSSPTTSKKPIIHSPYLKLFNVNNSTSSVQSERMQLAEVTENKSEKYVSPKRKDCKNTIFKLKPSILNNINDPTLSLPSSVPFSIQNNSNISANINEKSAENKYTKWQLNPFENPKVDKERVIIPNDDKLDDSSFKKINNLNLTKISRKVKRTSKLANTRIIKKTPKIVKKEDKNKIKVSDGLADKEQYKVCITDSVINAKQADKNPLLLSECKNNNGSMGNNDLTKGLLNADFSHNLSNKIKDSNEGYDNDNTFVDATSPQYRSTQKSKTSLDSENDSNYSDSAKNCDNPMKDGNFTEAKRHTISKKRNGKGSSDTLIDISLGPSTTISSMQSYHCINVPKKTYSTRPMSTRGPLTPDKIFDGLKRTTSKKIEKNKSGKRKLFTPNSFIEEVSPLKPPDNSIHLSEIMIKDYPSGKTNKRKSSFSSNKVKQPKKEKLLSSDKPPESVYDFPDSNNSFETKEEWKILNTRRRSLRKKNVYHYKELSSGASGGSENEFIPRKKTKMTNTKKTALDPKVLTLMNEKISVNEKVSEFVLSMKDRRDMLRDEDLESEMELLEAPVEENKSDVSQLENGEPPVCLSMGEINVPSPQPSADSCSEISLSAPTEKLERRGNAEIINEIDFLESAIKNIECLSMSVKQNHPKVNSQEKFLSTVESFSNSSVEELNKKWVEARNSLQHMVANLDNLSESCTAFLKSYEKRMKDMIESSVSMLENDRNNSNKKSDDLCKELKKMCQRRHNVLKKLL